MCILRTQHAVDSQQTAPHFEQPIFKIPAQKSAAACHPERRHVSGADKLLVGRFGSRVERGKKPTTWA